MKYETLLSYSSLESERARVSCQHPRELVIARGGVEYKVLFVIARDIRARCYSGGEEVGTWRVPCRQQPIFIAARGSVVHCFARGERGMHPYVHPHVLSGGELCFGNAPRAAEFHAVMAALSNINLDSAVFQPNWRPRR